MNQSQIEPWNSEDPRVQAEWDRQQTDSWSTREDHESEIPESRPISKRETARIKSDVKNFHRNQKIETSTANWLAKHPAPSQYVDPSMLQHAQGLYAELQSGRGDPSVIIPMLTEFEKQERANTNRKNEQYVLGGNPYQSPTEKYFELIRYNQKHGGGMVEITPAIQAAMDAEKGRKSSYQQARIDTGEQYMTGTNNTPRSESPIQGIPITSSEGYYNGKSGCVQFLTKLFFVLLVITTIFACSAMYIYVVRQAAP